MISAGFLGWGWEGCWEQAGMVIIGGHGYTWDFIGIDAIIVRNGSGCNPSDTVSAQPIKKVLPVSAGELLEYSLTEGNDDGS